MQFQRGWNSHGNSIMPRLGHWMGRSGHCELKLGHLSQWIWKAQILRFPWTLWTCRRSSHHPCSRLVLPTCSKTIQRLLSCKIHVLLRKYLPPALATRKIIGINSQNNSFRNGLRQKPEEYIWVLDQGWQNINFGRRIYHYRNTGFNAQTKTMGHVTNTLLGWLLEAWRNWWHA